LELKPGQQVACHHPENAADQAPEGGAVLASAREAIEIVTATPKSAESAELAESAEPTESAKPAEVSVTKSAEAEAANASDAEPEVSKDSEVSKDPEGSGGSPKTKE
jgi:peptide/nickel transport system ATP-binding protein